MNSVNQFRTKWFWLHCQQEIVAITIMAIEAIFGGLLFDLINETVAKLNYYICYMP